MLNCIKPSSLKNDYVQDELMIEGRCEAPRPDTIVQII